MPIREKATVRPSELPAACRTWDDRRRAWKPKARFATEHEARRLVGKKMRAHLCPTGDHYHVGHPSQGRR